MAQRSIPESSPSIKHTWVDRSQMAQTPHCTTHCNISLCHCWEVTALPQHPCLLTPLPTMAISGSAWAQQSSALILNRIDLIGWWRWWWELSYWKTHIKTRSQTRNTRHQKYPLLISHGIWQSQENISHQKQPNQTKFCSSTLTGKENNWFFHGKDGSGLPETNTGLDMSGFSLLTQTDSWLFKTLHIICMGGCWEVSLEMLSLCEIEASETGKDIN